jgi:hypothetical protein
VSASRTAAGLAIALAACGSNAYLDLPPHEGMSSLLLAGDAVSAHRLDGRPIALDLRRGSTLTALVYRSTLEELSLAEGTLEAVDPGACGSRSLPEDDGRYVATVGDGAFEAIAELPRAIADLRIAGPCPCRPLAVERRFTLHPTLPRIGLLTDPEHMTVYGFGNAAGESVAIRVSLESFEEVVVSTGTPAIVVASGAFGPGGEVWIGAAGGVLYHGPAVGPLTALGTPSAGVIGSVHGSEPGDPLDLWFVTTAAEIFRYDGASFTRVYLEEHPSAGTKQVGVIVRRSATEVYGALPDRQGVFTTDGVETSIEDFGDWVRAMRDVPALGGVVFGTWSGHFHRLDAGRREELPGPEGLPPVKILPAEDGFWFVSSDIDVGQYVAGYGLCAERLQGLGLTRAFGFERIRDRLLIVGAGDTGTEAVVLD